MNKREKEKRASRARVMQRDGGQCAVRRCERGATIWAHILPRGSHPQFAALDINTVMMCPRHDYVMGEIYPGRLRVDWLEEVGREPIQINMELLRETIKKESA